MHPSSILVPENLLFQAARSYRPTRNCQRVKWLFLFNAQNFFNTLLDEFSEMKLEDVKEIGLMYIQYTRFEPMASIYEQSSYEKKEL